MTQARITLAAQDNTGPAFKSAQGNLARVQGAAVSAQSALALLGTLAAASAVAAANYKGAWSSLSGALNIPASVTHSGKIWLLVSNTANVTTITPGVSGQWLEIDPAYLEVQQTIASAAYQIVLSDSGKHILHPSADTTARIFTVPANASVAFPIGTALTIVNQNGAGVVTIAITTDTMRLAGTGSTGSRTLAANGMATLLKLTATEWIISGVGLT